MSLWILLSRPFCGTDRAGHVHAATARPKSKRKTYDALCGRRVRLLAVPTIKGDGVTIPWPPYVADAREWGLERCPACMTAAPGRPQRHGLKPASEAGAS